MQKLTSSDLFEPNMALPHPSPSSDSNMEDPEGPRRMGVETREEVLRQVREHEWEIIELDPDPTPTSNKAHESYSYHPGHSTQIPQITHTLPVIQKRTRDPEPDYLTQPAKQRRLLDGIDTGTNTKQTEEHQSNLDLAPISATQNSAPKHKKSLWCSSKAKENMLKISSLPSPESTSSSQSTGSRSSPHSNKSGLNLFNSSSWSFGDIDEPRPTCKSGSTTSGSHTTSERAAESSRPSPPGRSSDALVDPMEQRRKDLEQSGIAESQKLRAQHQNRMRRPTLIRNPGVSTKSRSPNSSRVAPQSGTGHDIARSDHRDRSPIRGRNEDDSAALERYFDMLMDNERSQRGLSATDNNRQQGACPGKSSLSLPNPYSREAADKWRTQSRHLNHSQRAAAALSTEPANDCEVLNVHDDEMRIAQVRAGAYQIKAIKRDRAAEQRLLRKKFFAPDLEGRSKTTKSAPKPICKPRPLARTQAEVQSDLERLMGTTRSASRTQVTDSDKLDSNKDEQNETSETAQRTSLPVPTLSALNQLSSGTKKLGSTSNSEDLISKEAIDNLPEQGILLKLALPKNFHRYTESEKEVFTEREIKKEREKDLDVIRTVFTLGAQLGSLNAFDTSDPKIILQLTLLKRFTEAILEQQKSGKPIRHQIRSIRDAFKRRLDSVGREPDAEAADKYLPVLLQPELFNKLSADTVEVKERLAFLQSESHRINKFYHGKFDPRKNHRGAKVLLITKDSTGKLISFNPSSQSKVPSTKQRLSELRALHAQYSQSIQNGEEEVETIDLGPSRDDDTDNDEISEEDEGEDFMRPAGLLKQPEPAVPDQLISPEEVDCLETDRQQAEVHSTSNTQPSQAVDQRLLKSMLARRQQQGHLGSQGVQKSDLQVAHENRQRRIMSATSVKKPAPTLVGTAGSEGSEEEADYDIDQVSSQEFDDTDIDADDDDNEDNEHEDNEPICRRYIAKGICHGVSKELDASEHLLGKYLNKESARKKIHEFTRSIKELVPKRRPELDFDTVKESLNETKGSFEQKVVFGSDENVVCRAWFVEELHNPSEEAYQKAKVYMACQPTPIWFVRWERTISPYKEPEEDEESGDKITDESDNTSKFENENSAGEDTSEPEESSANEMTRTETGHDVDMGHISMEPSQPDDTLTSPGSPIDSSVSSSAATLVSEANDNVKECLMTNAYVDAEISAEVDVDVDVDVDVGDTAVEDKTDDLFSGEPDLINTPTSPPPPSPKPIPQPQSQHPSPQPDPPPTPRQTTTTVPTIDQLRHFSTRSLANRHAKNIFMHWYIERLPGPNNHGHIALEDEWMEEELKRMGDHSCWSRTEEFYRVDEDENGDEAGTGGGEKVLDRLRVWVVEGKCFGPRN